MALPILAQIGIGLISSIVGSVVSNAITRNPEGKESAVQDTPSSRVNISDAAATLKKNAETAKASGAPSPMDLFFAKAPDSVKEAWEKTRETLGLDAGNEGYYVNDLSMMALTAQSAPAPGEKAAGSPDVFGSSLSSAIGAVDAAIERLNAPASGYSPALRDRQAALEMFSTFRQHLVNASSTTQT